MFDKKAIIEGAKEVLRLAFFAAITAVVAWLTEKVGGADPSSTFYIVGTLVLRFADKYVHKSDIKANGIAPF